MLVGRLIVFAFGVIWRAFHASKLKRWLSLGSDRRKRRYYLLVPYWTGCSAFGVACMIFALLPR
jgi:hypothetical protein